MGGIENDNNHSNNNIDNNNNNEDIHEIECIWIDKEIHNNENKIIYENIFEKKNLNCKKFDNIDESFNYLNKKENYFKEFIIIISGRLFNSFYYKIQNNINLIKFIPNIIVFTSQKNLNFFINQLKMNNIYYNNNLFDTRFIFTKTSEIEDFIKNNIKEETYVSFDLIDDEEQLIIPTFYSYLLEDVNQTEIDYFNNYLINEFPFVNIKVNNMQNKEEIMKLKNNKIHELVNQIKQRKLPKELLLKYWLKIYISNSKFNYYINKSLRQRDKRVCFYYPFIKLCYEGIRKDFIKPYNKMIFRCSKITKKEFNILNNNFFSKINKNNNKFPNLIVFSKYFMSFYADINQAKKLKEESEGTFSIMYIIHEIDNKETKIYNANIEEFSDFPNEKTVLIFPFSCFEIIDIKMINSDGINYEIHLKYLGYYHEFIKNKKTADFLDKIQISTFSEELIESGLVKSNDFFSVWENKDKFEIKFDKICFFLDDMETLIGFKDKEIIVFNINKNEIKQTIKIHKSKILNLIKYSSDKICSYSQNEMIKIIKLIENNTKFKVVDIIDLAQNSVSQMLLLNNKDIVCLDNLNNFLFYTLNNDKYNGNYSTILSEKNNILVMKELNNDKIVYIAEDKLGNKLIKFIDLQKKIIEKNHINLQENKEKKMNLIDLLIFNDYLLVVYNYGIDIINYKNLALKIHPLINFNFEITNAIIHSINRIILGLYDSTKGESIIREHLLRVEDLNNDSCRFDCIGEGKLKLQKIGDIIKINEAQILANVNNNHCLIYERKNVISEKLKENLLHIIKNKKEDNSSNDGILGESEVILNNEENSINISNNINIINKNSNNNLFN